MAVKTGLDRMLEDGFARFKGKSLALLCNQASVDRSLSHIIDLLLPRHQQGVLNIRKVFGPQHGPYGHTQDNMLEWEGYVETRTGLRFASLYGAHRKPTPEMLRGVDLFVVDLQDVGARYYTFIWTMLLCMEACETAGIPFLILDRPNPIGGVEVEGHGVDPGYESFVGLHSLPMRHGLTIGKIGLKLRAERTPSLELEVVETQNWQREMFWGDTGLPWVPPSPNMPSPQTALVYPGMCLLEGTNLSEGRGTTRPFEWIGAPFLDSWQFAVEVTAQNLPGVIFRPAPFQPTFQKHAGLYCGGVFLHVLEPRAFRPIATAIAVLSAAKKLAPQDFAWKPPPYEYEERLLPIDILAGGPWLRELIDS